jgi:hypothetical protein
MYLLLDSRVEMGWLMTGLVTDAIDPAKSHVQAMKLLEDAGVYVLVVGLPSTLQSESK